MSTRIFNGYRIPNHWDLTRIQKEFGAVQTRFKNIIKKQATKELSALTIGILDRLALGLETDYITARHHFGNASPISLAYEHYRELRQIIGKHREQQPWEASWQLLRSNGKNLVLFYTSNRRLTRLWEALPWVSEYGFWNNTDWPKGMTARRWRQRERDWEPICQASCPATGSFNLQLFADWDDPYFQSVAEVIKYMPSLETRATTLARMEVDKQYGAKHKSEPYEYAKAIQEPKFEIEVAALADSFKAKLKNPVTKQDLLEAPEDRKLPWSKATPELIDAWLSEIIDGWKWYDTKIGLIFVNPTAPVPEAAQLSPTPHAEQLARWAAANPQKLPTWVRGVTNDYILTKLEQRHMSHYITSTLKHRTETLPFGPFSVKPIDIAKAVFERVGLRLVE